MQWMLPLGMDYAFNAIILAAGGVNVVLAIVLAPRYAHLGMAAAVAISEILVTTMMYLWLRRKGVGLLSHSAKAAVRSEGISVVAGSSFPGESVE
jgi:PST family polysaccharide transporter